MRAACVLASLFLVACGSDREAHAPIVDTPEPPRPTAHADPIVPEAADEPVEPSVPDPPRVTFAIPADGPLPTLTSLPTSLVTAHGAIWEEVRHPDPIARRRIAQLVEQLAYAWGTVPSGMIPSDDERAGCRVRLATERVVAIACRPLVQDRGGGTLLAPQGDLVAHFVIDGSEVRPFDLDDALREGESWGELIDMPHCVSQLGEQGFASSSATRVCRERLPSAEAVLTRTGIDLLLAEITIARSFRSIREHVREDGPIAWLFAHAEQPPTPSAEESDGWAIGEVAPAAEIAARSAEWNDDARAGAIVVDRGLGAAQVAVAKAEGYARAARIARAIGAPARRSRWEGDVRRAVRARSRADAEAVARRGEIEVLPAGTLVSALVPSQVTLGEGTSEIEIAASSRITGHVRSCDVSAYSGCVPDASAFLATLDDGDREEARARMVEASITLSGGQDATLFVARAGSRTHARVEARSADCIAAEALLSLTLPRPACDVRMTSTEPDRGEPLLVIGFFAGAAEERRYSVVHVPSGRRVLETGIEFDGTRWRPLLDRVRLGVRDGDRYWPIVVDLTRYRWDGRRLVEDRPPE